jgi:hypothetical protein
VRVLLDATRAGCAPAALAWGVGTRRPVRSGALLFVVGTAAGAGRISLRRMFSGRGKRTVDGQADGSLSALAGRLRIAPTLV